MQAAHTLTPPHWQASAKPLSGVRVVSLALNLPGPRACQHLAALGAAVTKVEAPAGDPMAHYSPLWYAELSAGMCVQIIDLKTKDGQVDFHQLLNNADVLVTAARPSALARLDITGETLARQHPQLNWIGIFGDLGDGAAHAGHDLTYQAQAGLIQPGHMPASLFVDMAGALEAAAATLTALRLRDQTGRGAHLSVSLARTAQMLAEPVGHQLTGDRTRSLGGGFPYYRLYETADGEIAFAALEHRFQKNFERVTGQLPDTSSALAALFRQRSTAEWLALAREHDLPIAAVASGTAIPSTEA